VTADLRAGIEALARAIFAADPPVNPHGPNSDLVFDEPYTSYQTERARKIARALLAAPPVVADAYVRYPVAPGYVWDRYVEDINHDRREGYIEAIAAHPVQDERVEPEVEEQWCEARFGDGMICTLPSLPDHGNYHAEDGYEIRPIRPAPAGDVPVQVTTAEEFAIVSAEKVEAVVKVLAGWGIRSYHGEWSDEETQRNVARLVFAALGVTVTDTPTEGGADRG
jgi:hypothetical protein